jgi:hypothetical protein
VLVLVLIFIIIIFIIISILIIVPVDMKHIYIYSIFICQFSFLQQFLHQSRHEHAVKRVRGPSGRFLTAAEKEAAEKEAVDEDVSFVGRGNTPEEGTSQDEECIRCDSLGLQHHTEKMDGAEHDSLEAWKYAHENYSAGAGQGFEGMNLPLSSELDSRNSGHHPLSV